MHAKFREDRTVPTSPMKGLVLVWYLVGASLSQNDDVVDAVKEFVSPDFRISNEDTPSKTVLIDSNGSDAAPTVVGID
jgi:hypothetical protein